MKQFSRFLLVGAANTVLGYAIIFGCMYRLGLSAESSNALGYSFGLLLAYLLNRFYTFNSTRRVGSEALKFGVVFAVSYSLNFLVLVILIRVLGVHPGLSQVLAGVVYVVTSYNLNKNYVFQTSQPH